jgi:hypothetical protein
VFYQLPLPIHNGAEDIVIIMEYLAQVASGHLQWNLDEMQERVAHLDPGVNIPEDVLKAAAGNIWHGVPMMKMLLNKELVKIDITEEVVKAAAGNEMAGKGVMTVLLEQIGADVVITKEGKVMTLLFSLTILLIHSVVKSRYITFIILGNRKISYHE